MDMAFTTYEVVERPMVSGKKNSNEAAVAARKQNNTDYSRGSKLRDKSFLTPAEKPSEDIIHKRVNSEVEAKIRFLAGAKMPRKKLEYIYGKDAVWAVLGDPK